MSLSVALTYRKVARIWLVGMLYFIPFQHNIVRVIRPLNNDVSTFIRQMDELTVFFFTPLALIELYRSKNITNWHYPVLFFPLFVFAIFGLISGLSMGNPLHMTVFGIFDYVKYYFLVMIYSAFFVEFNDIKKIFRMLLIIAVFLGVVALIQEIWALMYRYIFHENVLESKMYLFRTNIRESIADNLYWRLGIYKAPSLMHNSGYFALYCLFILTLYFNIKNKMKVNIALITPLVLGILFSVSRMIYAGFIIIAGVRIILGGRKIIFMLIPILIGIIIMAFLSDFHIGKKLNIPLLSDIRITSETSGSKISFREYTKNKSLEIFKDHPFRGVGPGMFGGIISMKFHSPVYEEYNFKNEWLFTASKGVDQFWPRALAEIGMCGTGLYIAIIVSLLLIINTLRRRSVLIDLKNMYSGLILFMVIIIIWGFGSGLNNSIVFSYMSFVGMVIGCYSESGENQENCDGYD